MLNHMKSVCRRMNEEISMLRIEIHDKMVKKFGMEIDFDEMEESVLIKMIANQTTVCADDREHQIEVAKLKVSFSYELHVKIFCS